MSTSASVIEQKNSEASSLTYKWTEAGVIPADWTMSTVGEEFKVQLGKMLDSAKNTGVLKPYIGNRAVQWNEILVDELPSARMTRSDLQKFRLKAGDLLVCEGGEIGRSAIWQEQLDECYYQKALHRLRSKHGYSARLMMAMLQLWSSNGHLANYVTQTSIAHLAKDQLQRVPLPVPLPKEQTDITAILSDADKFICAVNELIAKKRSIKLATMQQLLTERTRQPGFTGKWQSQKLQRIVNDFIVPMRDKPKRFGGNVPWCRIEDFDGKYLCGSKSGQCVDKRSIDAMNLKVHPVGTLLVSCSADLGRCAIVRTPLVTNQTFIGLVVNDAVASNEFLYYFMVFNAAVLNTAQ